MTISRRSALKSLGAIPFLRFEQPEDRAVLEAIAEVVLPAEADRKAAVTAFTRWIAGYKENADTDHGYGNTRVRSTGPSPARNYAAQIAALDTAAKATGAAGFAAATVDQRRAVVEAAIAEARIERLPGRPTGAHIAADLMGHYFNSAEASDLCYRAAIRRDACRGLAGSDKKPAPLAPRASGVASRASRIPPRA
jgi:hypothetical protein